VKWALLEWRREYGNIRAYCGQGKTFLRVPSTPLSPRLMTSPQPILSLSGRQVRDMFEAAMVWLERHVEQVNAVNVFPVPDGDTGTNMFLTMRSTLQEADKSAASSASEMLAAMSHGALMGARGNSGVILSQIIRGISESHAERDAMDAATLADGLAAGSDAAYKAVTRPAEGTILTVVREASETVRRARDSGEDGLLQLVDAACKAAHASVERTPTLLPALAEAGVVDAGGLGLAYLLQGMLKHLRGESLDEPVAAEVDSVGRGWLEMTEQRHATEESLYGYCTEVLVSGSSLDPESLRERMMELGDSVLVVGDDHLVRVHVHTDDPGAVLTYGTSVGSLAQVKVDNIRGQAERFVQMHEDRGAEAPPAGNVSTVAVVAGEGMAGVFESVGCTRLVSGGPTMNPSTQDIVEAAEACPAKDVVILPNDKNIIMAAKQAARATRKRVHIIESRSMPQGISALLAVNPEDSLKENLQAMKEALGSVQTIEVTHAVRSTSVGGVAVKKGQAIAVIDDQLRHATDSPENAVLQALEGVISPSTSLITIYRGDETTEAAASSLADTLRERFSTHEVELHFGGQPHYDYIVSVE
jgi:fatty acid kinase